MFLQRSYSVAALSSFQESHQRHSGRFPPPLLLLPLELRSTDCLNNSTNSPRQNLSLRGTQHTLSAIKKKSLLVILNHWQFRLQVILRTESSLSLSLSQSNDPRPFSFNRGTCTSWHSRALYLDLLALGRNLPPLIRPSENPLSQPFISRNTHLHSSSTARILAQSKIPNQLPFLTPSFSLQPSVVSFLELHVLF